MIKLFKLLSSGIAFGVLSLAWPLQFSAAEYIGPEQIRVRTPDYQPSFATFDPPLGTYTFKVGWQGLPAATLILSVAQDGVNYRINADAKTYKMIDIFYRLRFHSEGLISAVDLMPLETVVSQRENSRNKYTRIKYHEGGEIESLHRKSKGSGSPQFEILRFKSGNVTLDPFSAAFLARSLEWQVGDEREFDTYNGRTRYLITLRCTDKRDVSVNGRKLESWVIEPSVKNLSNPAANKKFRSAKIYLRADKSRDILRIDSSVFIGTVRTELEEFSPAPQSSSSSTVAMLRRNKFGSRIN